MEIFVGLAIVGIALAIAFGLSLRKRNEIDVESEDKPKRLSRRERKLQEIRSNEPGHWGHLYNPLCTTRRVAQLSFRNASSLK